MSDRYSVDQLSRMTEADVVRRELDLRNLQSLVWLLILFGVIRILELGSRTMQGTITDGQLRVLMSSSTFNLWGMFFVIAARKWPKLRRGVSAWVIAFCVMQFFFLALTPTDKQAMWFYASFLTLLYARFLLSKTQTLVLFGFLIVSTIVLALILPFPETKGAHPVTARLVLLTVSVLVLAAAANTQLARARRARAEIADEWREPLHSAREQLRMRDELQYARQMQLAMLPNAPPRLEWIDIAAVSIPAAEVGGDYYDFFDHEGRLSIVACDVAGHGMKSGLVLAAMRGGLITTLRRSLSNPAAVLGQLHELVLYTSRQRMLATAVVVMLDRAAGRAVVASAGHPPILVRRGESVRMIDVASPPLGVRLPFTIEEHHFDIGAGDILVLHSDGVYESRNATGETYGLERLQQVVVRHPPDGSAESLREAILRDLGTFRGDARQDDDVTVVVAKIVT